MPLYTFNCPDHGPFDSREPYGTDAVHCPCGKAASRDSVYRINFGGFASTAVGQAVKPDDYRRFTEASSELDYKASRLESEGATVATPNYFKAAKHEARKMAAAGVTADQIGG